MNRQRKKVPSPEKLAILKRYLVEKVPISDLLRAITIIDGLSIEIIEGPIRLGKWGRFACRRVRFPRKMGVSASH